MQNKLTYFTMSFIIIFSIVFIVSCGSDKVTNTNINPPEPVDTSDFQYPFTTGTNWSYTKTYSAENIRPDSIRYLFNSYPFTGTGYSEILYDTTIPLGGEVRIIYDIIIENNDTIGSRFYYTNSPNSLVCYGRRGGSTPSFPYSIIPGIRFKTQDRIFNSLNDLGLFVAGYNTDYISAGDTFINESPVKVVLKYPVVTNTEWIFKDFGTANIKKKYVSWVNYHLDTSVIACMKTERKWSNEPDYILYDYHSKYGQMKRDYLIKNNQVLNQFGLTIGFVDYRETYNVTSFNISNK